MKENVSFHFCLNELIDRLEHCMGVGSMQEGYEADTSLTRARWPTEKFNSTQAHGTHTQPDCFPMQMTTSHTFSSLLLGRHTFVSFGEGNCSFCQHVLPNLEFIA